MTQTKKDLLTISKIANRGATLLDWDNMTIFMDLSNCHKKNPLRLDDMLHSDNSNLCHDLIGINANLDHATLELKNCFYPRYSANL